MAAAAWKSWRFEGAGRLRIRHRFEIQLVPNSCGATVARTFRIDKLARHVLQAKRDARKLRATHD